MTYNELVYSVVCPTCGADEGEPCIYLWPKGVAECEFWEESDICFKHSDGQHERIAKVGNATKAPHHARNQAANNRRVRAQKLAEQQQLREWFLRYGNIFAID